MHICYLCSEYPPFQRGGVGSFTQCLARGMARRGHEVSVLGFYPQQRAETEEDCGVRVIRLPHTQWRGLGIVVNARRLRATLQILHRQSPLAILEGPEMALAIVSPRFPVIKVIRMNGGHHFFRHALGQRRNPWSSWLERRSFQRADVLCAVSHHVADSTRELLALNGRTIQIVPNPVDTALFRPRDDIKEEEGLVVFAGTVTEKKGIRQLVASMEHVLQEVPTAKLLIAGRDTTDTLTGRSYTALLRQSLPPQSEGAIDFLGPIPHSRLPELLARASVCVYPSHMEAMPLAWLEGMAMGKAVVGSQTGPGPEVIENGVSGVLCDPYSATAIGNSILRLLKDGQLRNTLGARARERVLHKFSIDRLVQVNEEFYGQCVAEHGRA